MCAVWLHRVQLVANLQTNRVQARRVFLVAFALFHIDYETQSKQIKLSIQPLAYVIAPLMNQQSISCIANNASDKTYSKPIWFMVITGIGRQQLNVC